MQYRALGRYGVGVSFASDGLRELSTNSGESIFPRCERNKGRHGATPTLDGVVAVVDIVRAMRSNLRRAVEAILNVGSLQLASLRAFVYAFVCKAVGS
jgi:hypothetical protein